MKKVSISTIFIILLFAVSMCKQSQTDEVESISSPEQIYEPEATHPGETLYLRYCLACHQADGTGVPGMHPTLVKTDWVLGDKERLIRIVLNGIKGPIDVNGESFNSIMAPMDFINDEDLADILTYIRSSFGNDAGEVTAEEVAKVRAEETD